MRVVRSGQQIESRRVTLDRVEADAAPDNRTQIQALKLVVKEVSVHESEYTRREVAVVACAAANRVGGGGRSRALLVVGCVNRVGVQNQFVFESLACCVKRDIEILTRAIAAGQSETQVQAAVPSFAQPWVQTLFIRP